MGESTDPLPGWDAIGFSYDVFGFYANPRSVMKQLFDLSPTSKRILHDGITWHISSDIEFRDISDTKSDKHSWRTKDAYTQELARKVKLSGTENVYNLFSGSVESDFSSSLKDETDCSYTSVRTVVAKWKLKLLPSVEDLRSKLFRSVKEDLEKTEPRQLFDKYGTHYLSEILVGGRAEYAATTKTSAFNDETTITIAAEASFTSVVNGNVSQEKKELVERFREYSSTKLYAIGGEAMSSITDASAYKDWLKSTHTHPVFCEFNKDSLRPLWELAESNERRQALKKATEIYIPMSCERTAIVEVDIVVGENSQVNPPYGFAKIDYDLNRNAKGKFIYLCYKREKICVATGLSSSSGSKPITSLDVVYGDNDSPSVLPGYTKIRKDLNMGAGGKFIYLCYSRDPSKSKDGLPLRGMRVVGNQKLENVVTPYGFERIDVDLNMGTERIDAAKVAETAAAALVPWIVIFDPPKPPISRGDWIFICYSRHLE